MKSSLLAVFYALMLLYSAATPALEIKNVHHDRAAFDIEKGEQISIQFTLSSAATVALNIFDGRELLMRTLATQTVLPAGVHQLSWDGKDQAGHPVSPGAYHYTLQAKASSGETVEHDLTDLTGGSDLEVKDIKWDPEQGKLRYVLPATARVNIRVGLKNDGPLLRTLINWVPRTGGLREETWDGKDESGVLDLSHHPQLLIGIQAYSLSDNAIVIGPDQNMVTLVEDLSWGKTRRVVKQSSQKRMYAHEQQPLETRGDFAIELKLPDRTPRNKDGITVVSGVVPVRLDIDDKDRVRALARRFEPVFYLDGIFVFENETGFLPMTWNWDASSVNPGLHYLTANLRGYEGNFGIATLKVYVKPKEGQADE